MEVENLYCQFFAYFTEPILADFIMLFNSHPIIKWRWNKFCCNYFDAKPHFDWTVTFTYRFVDECYAGLHNCHNDAYCTNTKRSFTCTCRPGYNGDGVNCAGNIIWSWNEQDFILSHMLFHAKNNTAKWKGRNLFSYSVSGMSQVVSTKRVLALVRVKLWPLIFPHKSIVTEIILTAKKVYVKPTL